MNRRMRFSTKTLIFAVGVVSILLAATRFCLVRWPQATQSFLVGAAAWALMEGIWRGTSHHGLPHNTGRIVGFSLLGMILMVATRLAPSLPIAIAGLSAGGLTSLLMHCWGTRVLSWAGVKG
ncbi:hypothetical protein NG895_13525 [Aeoliella sp. ICT_H6.2]|uniref:Uncharacterized protein n=1 Tax=Aeoliella straminimaris TaxID=2954799 RepID=A0A9X2JJF2_9BACT|nr:hypothetical protein [Aeoliella straminimaris]MCO6044924.1 hypothetical protein [Aeoliella straminimaris]